LVVALTVFDRGGFDQPYNTPPREDVSRGLSTNERRIDDLIEKLLLDMKGVALLQGSDSELRERIQAKVAGSRDFNVQRFVVALQSGRRPGTGRLLVVALGELIVASLLVIAGAVVILPTVVGISTPSALIQYFTQEVYGGLGASPLSEYISLIEFVMGAFLMISAFYALRQAALDLKEAGVAVKSGEG
jgi:hypothetical protein